MPGHAQNYANIIYKSLNNTYELGHSSYASTGPSIVTTLGIVYTHTIVTVA